VYEQKAARQQHAINTKQSCSRGLPWCPGTGTQNGEILLGLFGKLRPQGMVPKTEQNHRATYAPL